MSLHVVGPICADCRVGLCQEFTTRPGCYLRAGTVLYGVILRVCGSVGLYVRLSR